VSTVTVFPLHPTPLARSVGSLAALPAQIGGWLVALRSFPDDPAVVGACAETMTNYAQKISLGEGVASVDIVGTGGDGMDTFNCSTACSFMVAACGLKVSKHGNRSASGNVGSADLLEGLGANIMLDADKVLSCIEGSGFGFLFAQKFHPAMRYVMPARKQLGVRTVFNMLGPLTNPCRPTAQLIGVGVESMAPLYASIFAARGGKTMIVHSTDGLDEISCEVRRDPPLPRLIEAPWYPFASGCQWV
jgi:anthranilate phosphoribosyltransferase